MAAVDMNLKIDWEKYRPTRVVLWRAIGAWAGISLATTVLMYVLVLTGRSDAVIGGDFTAFHTAAKAALQGAAAQIYDPTFFQTLLPAAVLAGEGTLSWQYPPTYLLLMTPFAALPYFLAFALWSTATAAGYYAAVRQIIRDRLILFAIIAGPASFAAYITGQNGFLTAMLLLAACALPNKRPLLAGFAAGLLTMKPHLGLLIPIAYLAAGCWRAFGAAAITSIGLAVLSLAAFGAEPWVAFVTAVVETSGRVEAGIMPLAKMATPYSAALFAGAPALAAYLVYAASLGVSAAFVWFAWRRISDPLLRGAALVSCVLMAAPYGYYYELIILTFPGAVIVMRGLERGWLKYERPAIALAYSLPAFATTFSEYRHGLSLGFIVTLIIFGLVLRRAMHETPGLFSLKPGPIKQAGAPS
jgi:Glycosyltransferase family 87